MSQYIRKAHKGIGNNTRGAEHQLQVNKAITKTLKTRQTGLSTAGYDYKPKAQCPTH